MKATAVRVSRLKADRNNKYENERIEVEISISDGETAEQGVIAGRAFLAKQFGETPSEEEVAAAQAVIDRAKTQASL